MTAVASGACAGDVHAGAVLAAVQFAGTCDRGSGDL